MKPRDQLQVKYMCVENDQEKCQKRLDDAFDYLFEVLGFFETDCTNNKNEYEQPIATRE
jgi:hypothetical protein